jgi:hypothetical protein
MSEIKIVSKEDAEIRREDGMETIRYQLRKMLANLLRVQRGAGRPDQIYDDVVTLAVSMRNHLAEFERIGDGDLAKAIDCLQTCEDAFPRAEEQMLRGAMQIIASRLLGQKCQEAAGDNELFDGFRIIEELRASSPR